MTQNLIRSVTAAMLVLTFNATSAPAAIGVADAKPDLIAAAPIECAQAGVPVPDSLIPAGLCTPHGVPMPPTMIA
jgi:hypothetical protein